MIIMREFKEENHEEQIAPQTTDPENGLSERGEMPRRDFLRYLGATAVLFATEGCASMGATRGRLERTAELVDRREKFVKRWELVREEGLRKFESDPEMEKKYGRAGVSQLAEIVRGFDVALYIDTLAKIAGIRSEEIGGEILSFDIKLSREDGTMASVRDLRHMELYVGEWARFGEKFHGPTVVSVLRHEHAHLFSFDYRAPLMESVPLVYEEQSGGWMEKAHIERTLYEGATEVVARTAESVSSGDHSVEQGYAGGATLSAYVMAELLGRGDFIKAYLRRDTRLLKTLFDAKIGGDAHQSLMMPAAIGADLLDTNYNNSLDFLHNAFKSKQIAKERLAQILEKAVREGIGERAAHFEVEGLKITTHLYTTNDADDGPRYAFNAVVQAPSVYRFGKPVSSAGYPVTERFSTVVLNGVMSEDIRQKAIHATALVLKRHCEIKDPERFMLSESYGMVGCDAFVLEKLKELDTIKSEDQQFERIWQEINEHMIKIISTFVKAVYDQAGVSELISKERE